MTNYNSNPFIPNLYNLLEYSISKDKLKTLRAIHANIAFLKKVIIEDEESSLRKQREVILDLKNLLLHLELNFENISIHHQVSHLITGLDHSIFDFLQAYALISQKRFYAPDGLTNLS